MSTGSENQERSLREELQESAKEVFDRTRDEAGRFAKSEPVEAEVKIDPAQELGKEPETKVPAETVDTDPFPQSWKQDYKSHWSSVPKELKDYIRQHEADTRKAMTAQDEDRITGKSLRELVNPYVPMLQSEGVTANQAIQTMLGQHYTLRYGTAEQKRAMLLGAAKMFNIDLTEPTGTQSWVDPQVEALQKELADLKGWRQSYEQSVQMQEQATVSGQIQAFAADPKHTHFNNPQVQSLMGQFLMNGASSMEDAYEQACWSLKELRSTLLTEQQTQEEAKRAAEAKAKANAARQASGSVRGSSAGLSTATVQEPKGTLREELRAQFAATKNRI